MSEANKAAKGYSNQSLCFPKTYKKDKLRVLMKELRLKLKADTFSGRVVDFNPFENH